MGTACLLNNSAVCLTTIFTANFNRSCIKYVFRKWDQFTQILKDISPYSITMAWVKTVNFQNTCTSCRDRTYYMELLQNVEGVAIECDNFQVAVFTNCVEHKKHKHYAVSAAKCSLILAFDLLQITHLNWSLWHTAHSCNGDRKLNVTAQRHTTCPRRCGTIVTGQF
jgi:hypothetical protein